MNVLLLYLPQNLKLQLFLPHISHLLSQHQKLNLVSSCMTIIMTVAGVNCDAKVLDNEITCRIPKNMTIPSEGLPVKVSQAEGSMLTS